MFGVVQKNFAPRASNRLKASRAFVRLIVVVGVFSLLPDTRAEAPVRFNEQIRPLLNTQCVKCHGGVKEAGGLHLLFREQALKSGKSGQPAIVPGKPEQSELIARLITE